MNESAWQELKETLRNRFFQLKGGDCTNAEYQRWEHSVLINLVQDIRLCDATGLHWWQRQQIDEVMAHYD